MTATEFLARLAVREMNLYDRALALLWWAGQDNPNLGMTAKEICRELEAVGHPRQNASRLDGKLSADRQTSKASNGGWKLHPRARAALAADYGSLLDPRPLKASDSVLPRVLFAGTRGYIERVVDQINKSYDGELWDCCAVMCRRLFETMIIEAYEHARRANEIKGADGHFLMLNGLIAFLEGDSTIHLGRNAKKGLKDFKQLGDLSAHNRRFNAERNDLDRLRDGLRVAAEELLHLAGLRRGAAAATVDTT